VSREFRAFAARLRLRAKEAIRNVRARGPRPALVAGGSACARRRRVVRAALPTRAPEPRTTARSRPARGVISVLFRGRER
jgi:hypothetical protein